MATADISVKTTEDITAIEGKETTLKCYYKMDETSTDIIHAILWQKYNETIDSFETVFNSQVRK